MADNYAAAAEAVLSIAEQFRGITSLADALRSLGSVDNAIRERQEGLAKATAAHEEALAKVSAAGFELDNLKKAHAAEKAAHDGHLADAAAAAETAYSASLEKARADAAKIVADAQATADQTAAAHAEETRAAAAELAVVKSELALAISTRDAIRAEHEEVSKKMTDLRSIASAIAS